MSEHTPIAAAASKGSAEPAITVVVLTYDEEPNLTRVLEHLRWAHRVVVVDSFSRDRTLDIARGFPNVELFQRPFDNHTSQWNYGLDQVDTEWVLTLDADYVVPAETALEMQRLVRAEDADGYEADLIFCVRGKPLRHAILPPRLVLFRRSLGRYFQDGHTQKLALEGRTKSLEHGILHDDRKALKRWLWAQDRYADLELEKLTNTPTAALPWRDRIRKSVVIAPWLVPAYYLFAKGGVFDGWAGLDYAAQRAIAELVLSIKLIEARDSKARGAR
ncbi:MAG: glycosyltransferase family 2 protein [Myxococcales bacterium]